MRSLRRLACLSFEEDQSGSGRRGQIDPNVDAEVEYELRLMFREKLVELSQQTFGKRLHKVGSHRWCLYDSLGAEVGAEGGSAEVLGVLEGARAAEAGSFAALRGHHEGAAVGHHIGLGMRPLHQNEYEQGNQRKPGKRPGLKIVYVNWYGVFWRKVFNYVHKNNLWDEFCHQCDAIIKEIEARKYICGIVVVSYTEEILRG